MVEFTLWVPKAEKDRVDRILGIGKDQGIVVNAIFDFMGGRYKYEIECPKKTHAVEIRRRIGCTRSGMGKDVYHRKDEYGSWT